MKKLVKTMVLALSFLGFALFAGCSDSAPEVQETVEASEAVKEESCEEKNPGRFCFGGQHGISGNGGTSTPMPAGSGPFTGK